MMAYKTINSIGTMCIIWNVYIIIDLQHYSNKKQTRTRDILYPHSSLTTVNRCVKYPEKHVYANVSTLLES